MHLLKYFIRYPLFLLFPVIYLIGKVKKYLLKSDSKKILIVHFGGTGDRLIKEECLKNISVYEVIDKIDNELTNIYYENS